MWGTLVDGLDGSFRESRVAIDWHADVIGWQATAEFDDRQNWAHRRRFAWDRMAARHRLIMVAMVAAAAEARAVDCSGRTPANV